jgi:hypothetical protein
MRTLEEIHVDIEELTERRRELWHLLSQSHDATLADELTTLNERLDDLWAEHRQTRATLRFGDRQHIVARARTEERLERTAA